MDTPDVPVNEKKANPTVFFVIAGLQAITLIPLSRWGRPDWHGLTPIFFLILGINAWKGREIIQWFLNHFPPQERKIVYYRMSSVFALLVEMAMLASIPYFYMRFRENIVSYPESSLSTYLIMLGFGIICCISLYRVGCEFVKNYRLYQAALPQP